MSVPNVIRQSTFANLPSAANENGLAWLVTDANTPNPTAGGVPGSLVTVYSNGSNWTVLFPSVTISTITSNSNVPASPMPQTFIMDATSATFTATLPAANSYAGQQLTFKKKDATINPAVISGNGTNIDFNPFFYLTTQGQSITVQSDGTQWWIF